MLRKPPGHWTSTAGSVLTLCLIAGCATTASVRQARGSGVTRVYDASFATMYAAARRAIGQVGLNLVEAKEDVPGERATLVASQDMTTFSFGERVAIFVTAHGDQHVSVEIVSKRVVATNLFAKNWTSDLFAAIEAQLHQEAE